ncbi:hypothetical protein PspLS_10089 [Pyricularia sp. CBS 133598]|nr:hypothetical protein PspLS_10089 [Pyricularia sp. CBS 133598]
MTLLTAGTDEFEYLLEVRRRRRRSNAPSPEPEEQKRREIQDSRPPERTRMSADPGPQSRMPSTAEGFGVGRIRLDEPGQRSGRSADVAGIRWRRVEFEQGRRPGGAGTRGTQIRIDNVGGSAGRVVVGVRDRAAGVMM